MKKHKKSNNIYQKISLVITISFIITLVASTVYAESGGTVSIESVLKEVAGYLLWIGAAVCVGKLMQIGIMYITSSAEGKSNAKSAFLPWLVGAIILSAFATIGTAVIDIFGELKDKDVLDI